ncbi:hypothetical protein ABW16_01825 [Mycolicibacter heraklionensis]|uniref:Uncharacterized protein n=1 Tax=Mycolicibacter heraklionensis TaxID=512402 RepID=A0ABR5FKN3_9MYCO|nr:hypothetical protein [Mycolicibacter heraklionensis]KLO31596.1 hypothetical protein ABW16_01825 [Mycolicibacter heraklionensis]
MSQCPIPKCDNATGTRRRICRVHADELRDMLRSLVSTATHSGHRGPGALDYLDDACSGATKLGEQARHITEHDAPMPVNFNANSLQKSTAITIISWAIILHADIRTDLTIWGGHNAARQAATWLADNIEAIAYNEHVAQLHADIKRTITAIEHSINRRRPPRYCGPCPAPHPETPDRRCDAEITAHRRAKTIRCRQCKTEHQVDELIRENLDGLGHWHFHAHEVLRILDGFEIPISKTTFYRWRREGKLQPAHYDGAGKPLFLFADVQKLVEQSANKRTSNTPIHTTGA